jgi:hypothetical protein
MLLLSFINKANWTILTKGRRRYSSLPNPPLFLREIYRGCGGIGASIKKKK